MAYVNKMDITGANFYRVVDMMKDRLHANAVPIQLPIGAEADLPRHHRPDHHEAPRSTTMTTGTDVRDEEIPADMKEKAEEYRAALIESVAETDEALMEKYFSGEELTVEEIQRCDPQAHHRVQDDPRDCAVLPTATRAFSRCWTTIVYYHALSAGHSRRSRVPIPMIPTKEMERHACR